MVFVVLSEDEGQLLSADFHIRISFWEIKKADILRGTSA